jgi:hypothetical protein
VTDYHALSAVGFSRLVSDRWDVNWTQMGRITALCHAAPAQQRPRQRSHCGSGPVGATVLKGKEERDEEEEVQPAADHARQAVRPRVRPRQPQCTRSGLTSAPRGAPPCRGTGRPAPPAAPEAPAAARRGQRQETRRKQAQNQRL